MMANKKITVMDIYLSQKLVAYGEETLEAKAILFKYSAVLMDNDDEKGGKQKEA